MQLAYDRCGTGPPLVLLHAIGHRRQGWLPVVDRLAKHREVISLDFPGFGESPPLPDHLSYELDTAVIVLAEFFARLGLDRPHVAGNSMGGLISLVLAQRRMVRSATALSPAGLWTPMGRRVSLGMVRSVHRTARHMPDKLAVRLAQTAAGRTLMCGILFGRPDLLEPRVLLADMQAFVSAVGFGPTLATGDRTIFTGRVADVPVTIAWGTRDFLMWRPRAESVIRLIPHARLLRLPGCGHVPMNDNPDLVAHVLLTGSDEQAQPSPGSPGSHAVLMTEPLTEAITLPDGTLVRGRGRREPLPAGPLPDFGLYLGRPPSTRPRRGGRRKAAWEPAWPADWIHWPDFRAPRNDQLAAAAIIQAYRRARSGQRVEVACVGGTGRTGTVIACMAILAGHPADDAVGWTRRHYRLRAVETPAQRRWIRWFATNAHCP